MSEKIIKNLNSFNINGSVSILMIMVLSISFYWEKNSKFKYMAQLLMLIYFKSHNINYFNNIVCHYTEIVL